MQLVLLEAFERPAAFATIRTRLSESLPDEISADGPLIADALATLENALPRATTEAGRDLLARAAHILRI